MSNGIIRLDSLLRAILNDCLVHLQVGALANCGEPICCSAVNGFPPTKDNAASFYGDYHCDLPPWTLDMMFKEIRAKHPDIDFVIMTGDLPAHDIWRQNRTLNLESSEIVIESMKKHFGGKIESD